MRTAMHGNGELWLAVWCWRSAPASPRRQADSAGRRTSCGRAASSKLGWGMAAVGTNLSTFRRSVYAYRRRA